MANLLKDSMDNIFISSADILDKLTYKLSLATTNTVIPHNNDSLIRPLTDVLKKDFEAYNRVLDNYNLELQGSESMLTYLKVKGRKEAELRQKLETERVRKEKEEAERKAAERAKQEAEKKRNEKAAAAAAAAAAKKLEEQKKQQEIASAKELPSNNDDFMLDLDLDGFNLGQQAQADSGLLQFDGPSSEQQNTHTSLGSQQASQQPTIDNALGGHSNDSMNNLSQTPGMDSLNDLNLDFLDTAGGLGDNQSNGLGGGDLGSGNDGMNMLGSLHDFGQSSSGNALGAGNSGNGNAGNANLSGAGMPGNSAGNGQDDDDSLMAPDQMENLFSQFDELVGGNDGGM